MSFCTLKEKANESCTGTVSGAILLLQQMMLADILLGLHLDACLYSVLQYKYKVQR